MPGLTSLFQRLSERQIWSVKVDRLECSLMLDWRNRSHGAPTYYLGSSYLTALTNTFEKVHANRSQLDTILTSCIIALIQSVDYHWVKVVYIELPNHTRILHDKDLTEHNHIMANSGGIKTDRLVRITAQEFSAVASSKTEVYRWLSAEVGAYLD